MWQQRYSDVIYTSSESRGGKAGILGFFEACASRNSPRPRNPSDCRWRALERSTESPLRNGRSGSVRGPVVAVFLRVVRRKEGIWQRGGLADVALGDSAYAAERLEGAFRPTRSASPICERIAIPS